MNLPAMSTSSEKTPGQAGKVVGWKEVRVFVSSTFDDMHAERDYLVKEVFPRLREWCERRRLRLVDVDLRWGVTEADATNNKRVVDVCLRRIDDCRPFFICLLGQRYGWIPRREDVAEGTVGSYPHVADALGAASVTEMEILHATVEGKHVSDAFFYLREPSYLKDLPAEPAQLRQRVYTDESEVDGADRMEKLRVLREQKIARTGRPVRRYYARWNADLRTPEIALPLQCPATLPANIESWRKNWQRWAKVRVVGTDVNEDASQGAKAAEHNEKLTRGRLVDFAVRKCSLGAWILRDLRKAIAARFPDHMVASEPSDLQRELDLQEELINSARKGFIGRAADLAALDGYADGNDTRLFAVAAAGGIGKTTLLAKWISDRREHGDTVFCRFIGVGDRSSSVDSLLASLVDELQAAGRITSEIPTDPKKLREKLPDLLAECANHGRAIIVIDALNQLDSGLADLDWLPKAIPSGLKLVVSFKTGTPAAAELLTRWLSPPRPAARGEADARSAAGEGPVILHVCHGFDNIADRKALVTGYLDRHLKELDQSHLESLVTVPGAENPLYLRVVLGELRVFGAFGQLREKLAHDFGTTPIEAFAGVLRRLESDPAAASVSPAISVPLIFGLLAHTHGGLPEAAIVDLVEAEVNLGANRRRDVAASVALVLRQVRPYLAHREGRIDFFFESFQIAAKQRYSRPEAEWPVRSEAAWHDAIANWCAKWERLEGASQCYALRWLPTHQLAAGRSTDAAEVMTEFAYHHARLEKLGARDVIEVTKDFTALAKADLPADQREAVETWQRFHDENAHFLRRPGIRPQVELLQSAYAHADSSQVTHGAEAWLDTNGSEHWWFRKMGRPKKLVRNACLRVLEGHTGTVFSVALCADGRRAVSGSEDGTLRVWNLDTGACLRVFEGHTWAVNSVALCADGRRAVSGSQDKTLRVWDLDTGACLRVLEGHSETVKSVAVYRDGRRAVSGSWDGTLRVWNLDTGACLRVLEGHSGGVNSVAVFPDSRRAVSGSRDRTLCVWNLDTGGCPRELHGHTGSVNSVAVHADGRRVLSAAGEEHSQDMTLRVWDLNWGECLRVLEGHFGPVTSVALCADGRRAVSGAGFPDNTLRVWDLDTGAWRVWEGHSAQVVSVAVSADCRRAVSGSVDMTLRVWDLDSDEPLDMPADRHILWVSSVAVSADGRRALSGGVDCDLRVWDVDSGACLRVLKGHTAEVNSVAFCLGGRRALSSSKDATLRIWDLDTGACLHVLAGHAGQVSSVALSTDGRRALSGSEDRTLRVWDLDTGECLRVLEGHTHWVCSVATSADSRRAVSGSYDKTLRVWDLDTGECLRVLKGHSDVINSVAVCADGRRAVSQSGADTVRVWDLDTGACLRALGGHSIALSADGHRVVSVSRAGLDLGGKELLLVWDLDTGACLRVLEGHTGSVHWVAVCEDGHRAISSGDDNSLRAWDLDNGECLGTWPGGSALWHKALTKPLPNGRARVVSGCLDGSMHFFELMPPGPLTRTTFAVWSPTHPLIASALDTGAITLHQWHASSAQLEQLARSAPLASPISSLRFSLDGTRLQVVTTDRTEYILDAFTLQPAEGDRQVAPTTSPAWAEPDIISPDGAWGAIILHGWLRIARVVSGQ